MVIGKGGKRLVGVQQVMEERAHNYIMQIKVHNYVVWVL